MDDKRKVRLAIIGTSGRKPSNSRRLKQDHIVYMSNTVKDIIEHVLIILPKDVILMSGGSTW